MNNENEKDEKREKDEKKESEEEKKENQKEDPEIVELKKTMRKIREISAIALLLSLAVILTCCLVSRLNVWSPPRLITILLWVVFAVSLIFWYGSYAFKIVKAWENGVIFRLGRYLRTHKPIKRGWTIIIWPLDKIKFVDMREKEENVSPQKVITKDNVNVVFNAVFNYVVTNAEDSVINVSEPVKLLNRLTQVNLRDQVGSMTLDEANQSKGEINKVAIAYLNNITKGLIVGKDKDGKPIRKPWGVKVARVKIEEILPPERIIEVMHKLIEADRGKRARILEAEGEAEAIKKVFEGIHEGKPTDDLIAIKTLEALKKMADGQATKILYPFEVSKLIDNLSKKVEGLGKPLPEKAEELKK